MSSEVRCQFCWSVLWNSAGEEGAHKHWCPVVQPVCDVGGES